MSELDITRIVERDGLETKLEEVRRLKSEFLANMSHELRTPLNSIIGFAELMHKGKTGPLAPDHVEFLGDIITSARRLLQLVNDVLDLAKLESGKIDFHPIPIDLASLVGEVRDILKSQIAERNHKVEVILDLETVTLDPTRLKQVLYALMSNAVKYTPTRGKITVTARPSSSNTWELVVEDTGSGISADDLPKLFIEFPTISGGGGRGIGLGLALALRIVEGQGGRIDVTSEVDKGSTFTVTLPRALEHRHGSEPILVVDDNPVNTKLARAVLSRAGYDVTTAGDGHAALAAIEQHKPALIITDLMLPDLTGFDLMVRLKQDDRFCQIPVIAMTASGIANDEERARAAGCDGFMLKPFEIEALLTLVAKLLNELPESR